MTTSIAIPPKLQFFSSAGVPLSGGKLYSYAAGTTTPLATYTSSTGGTANTNPIILDSRGEANVWLDVGQYKLKLTSSTDVEIWTVDNLNGPDQATLAVLAASSGSSLVGYIQAGSGAVATTVQARLRKIIFTSDYDTFVNAVAAAANGTLVVNSTITVSANVTVPSTVVLQVINEGIFNIATAVTLTINGAFEAGVYRVFNCTGTGAVTFNWQFLSVGYPEWWGAAAVSSVDSYAGITACLLACQTTQLQIGDYWVSDTIVMDQPYRTLAGRGSQYESVDNTVTRLAVTSSSKNTLQVGPAVEPPGGINDFQRQNIVRDLMVSRTVAPLISSVCSSVLAQYTLYAQFTNVKTGVSIYGFQFYGNVYLVATNCAAVRADAGTGAGTDLWYGYYINGYADIGAAGGNASIYLNYCRAGCNLLALTQSGSIGLYADNSFSDLFVESFESVSCNVGMQILGNAGTGTAGSNTDCQIKNPINDSFYLYGIFIKNVNKYGSIAITEGYYGAGVTASVALYIQDSFGSVQVVGGQFVMFLAPTAQPIFITGSRGAIIDSCQILESSTLGVQLNNSSSCDIRPLIKNYQNVLATAGVQLNNTNTANTIAPIVYGNASYVALGVQLGGAANVRNEINCTGIDSACLAASSNKLQINSVSVTSTGLSGTNLVSGVMT